MNVRTRRHTDAHTLEEIHCRLLVSNSNQSRLRSSDLQRSFYTEFARFTFLVNIVRLSKRIYFQVSSLKMLQKTDGIM
jgi:hypothetical protein